MQRMDLVILDELDCLPLSQASKAFLFHLLSKLYGHRRVNHDQPELYQVIECVLGRHDNDGFVGSARASLPHRGDGR